MAFVRNQDKLVEDYMGFARAVCRRFAKTLPSYADIDSLESDAMYGLLAAARTYDDSCGTSFKLYAAKRIRGAILDGLGRLKKRNKGRSLPKIFSLDRVVGHDDYGEPVTLGEMLPSKDGPACVELERRESVDAVLRSAGPRDARDLADHYVRGVARKNIAKRDGVCESRVSQRFRSARLRIREAVCVADSDSRDRHQADTTRRVMVSRPPCSKSQISTCDA